MGPLYARSEFSLLQSVLRIEEYVKTAVSYGYTYATLSDHNVLFGAKAFDRCCKQYGIKPIFGLEMDFEDPLNRITFEAIALNAQGYLQLCNISLILAQRRLNWQDLSLLNQCALIAFNADGIFEQASKDEDFNAFNVIYNQMVAYHPNDNYLGLTRQEASYFAHINSIAFTYANQVGLKCVAINKTRYCFDYQAQAAYVINAIHDDKLISDKSLVKDVYRYLLTLDQYYQLYNESVLVNNDELANSVCFDLDELKTQLPKYPLKNNVNTSTYLSQLSHVGLCKRLNVTCLPDNYASRLTYELSIIHQMGFDDYFLIVYDYILYAKKHGILVGPGRGSAAGSLVSYSIGITDIDPIQYNLLFERFLNPSRSSMPDIDTDFPDNRRDEVIEYVVNKYGKQHVAHILTFGTLAAKQVVRDVAKAYGLHNFEVDRIVRCIPNAPKITLEMALQQSVALKQMQYENPMIASILEVAMQLEGLPRHCSTHAGGIVFSLKPFDQVGPMIALDDTMLTTQYTMEYLEDMGLIKMDFLGLRNLTILDSITKMIQQSQPNFSLKQIPLTDVKTFQLIAKADTIGVFQLESEGMKNLLKQLKPNCFNDIVAAVALFRPGPMELIPMYLKNKTNHKANYPNLAIKNILSETYGVMVYQEQVMQIAQIVANFTLAQADILRKAMSKKKKEEINRLRDEFIQGAIDNGYTQNNAMQWFDLIEKFSGYGFNKAHSVAYALIAYQLAYLKVNAPYPFYTAYLNSILGANAKITLTLQELTRNHIPVLPPDINESQLGFSMSNKGIRFALLSIKGVGSVIGKAIVNDRFVNGPFVSYTNAIARLVALKCSKAIIDSLIDAGALDCFNPNRFAMKLSLDDAMRYGDLITVYDKDGYHLDASLLSEPTLTVVKEDIMQKALNEAQALGVFLTVNPFANMRARFNVNTSMLSDCLNQGEGIFQGFGMVTRVKQHRTKKGDLMAFVSLMDESGTYETSIMPNLYQNIAPQLVEKTYCQVELKVNNKGVLINKCRILKASDERR